MTFRAIFWDNDGTLVNTEPAYFEATQTILQSAGIKLTREWYINEHLKKGVNSFELARRAGIPEETIQILKNHRNTLYADLLKSRIEILPGVLKTLDALRGKVPMAVVTTSHRINFDFIMQVTDLGKYFDFSVCMEDVEQVKPHPEPYLKAWKRSGFKKEECLVVEDTERGVTAAKAAGLTCYACPTLLSAKNDFSKADQILNNVSDMLEHFGL